MICGDISDAGDNSREYLIREDDGWYNAQQSELCQLDFPPSLQCDFQQILSVGTDYLALWLIRIAGNDCLGFPQQDDLVSRRSIKR